VAFKELRHNHRVVKHRIGAQLVIPLERHDETRQVLAGNRLNRSDIAKELTEAVEHGFVLAMRIRLFQRVDLLQVFGDGDVERLFLDRFAGGFKPGYTEFTPTFYRRMYRYSF
jgi:hypothetical protein